MNDFFNRVLENLSSVSSRLINPGENLSSARTLDKAPEEIDDASKDQNLETAAKEALESDTVEAKIRHDQLRSELEKLEYLTMDQKMRYHASRRMSIMASANNLDRIARDTKKEFGRP